MKSKCKYSQVNKQNLWPLFGRLLGVALTYGAGSHFLIALLLPMGILVTAESALSQASPVARQILEYRLSTGMLSNSGEKEAAVFEHMIDLEPEVPWIRIVFQDVFLPLGSYIELSSVLDGEVQLFDALTLEEWNNKSAYFNGSSVKLKVVAGANSEGTYVEIQEVVVGIPPASWSDAKTICGMSDDRVPANDPTKDPAIGRILPGGCTGFIVSCGATNGCHLSAGHCFDVPGDFDIIQFDVPSSDSDCDLNHPSVNKQFPIAQLSVVFSDGSDNDDWAVFETGRNPEGLTTFQKQGVALSLASSVVPGTAVVTGYGIDGGSGAGACACAPAGSTGTRNQTLQTDSGPFDDVVVDEVRYTLDTCGGNSGSPVFRQDTGEVVAIHTDGMCGGSGFNSGTLIFHDDLQDALSDCCQGPVLAIEVPTLSQWGIIFLGLILMVSGLAVIGRMRKYKGV